MSNVAAGGGQLPDVLQEAQVTVLELADCQERYSSTPYQVYDESICVFKLNDDDDHTGSCYVRILTIIKILKVLRIYSITGKTKYEL